MAGIVEDAWAYAASNTRQQRIKRIDTFGSDDVTVAPVEALNWSEPTVRYLAVEPQWVVPRQAESADGRHGADTAINTAARSPLASEPPSSSGRGPRSHAVRRNSNPGSALGPPEPSKSAEPRSKFAREISASRESY